MKFIKKIKKLTKSWAHRHRIRCAHAPQYLHGVACATHYCVRRAALIVAAAAMRCLRDGERGDKSNTVGVASWSARGGCVIASPMACSVVLRRLSCMAAPSCRCWCRAAACWCWPSSCRPACWCWPSGRCWLRRCWPDRTPRRWCWPLCCGVPVLADGPRRSGPFRADRLPCWPACPAGLAGRRAAGGLAGRRPGCSRAAAGKGLAGTNIAHAPVAAEKNFFTPSG